MLISDDNQEDIFEVKCLISYVLDHTISQPVTLIENAKFVVFVWNYGCPPHHCMERPYFKI